MSASHLRFMFLWMMIFLLAISIVGCKKKQIRDYEETGMMAEEAIPEEPVVEAEAAAEETLPVMDRGLIGTAVAGVTRISDTAALYTVYFDFDKSSLTPEAKKTLRQNAAVLIENKDVKVRVEGHCDERGTEEYNLALGERRALSTYRYLKALGVKSDQLMIISYGESRPEDPGHKEAAWSKNRRAQFTLISR